MKDSIASGLPLLPETSEGPSCSRQAGSKPLISLCVRSHLCVSLWLHQRTEGQLLSDFRAHLG